MEGIRNRFGYGVNLDFLSHMIDLGRVNLVTHRVSASAAKQVIRIKTGSKILHLVSLIKTGLAFPYDLYEGVTVTTPGTELTKVNPKRKMAGNLVDSKFYSGAVYSGGIKLKAGQSGFGTNAGLAKSGESSGGFYWEFLPDTEYVIDGTPAAATDETFEFVMFETDN